MQARPKFVILKNKDRFRSFQCTLYHAVCCKQTCGCIRKERIEADRKGEYHFVERSLFLKARQQSEMLPPEVLEIPQVKAALDSGKLVEVTKRTPIQIFPGKE
jgi:hypothetical protein